MKSGVQLTAAAINPATEKPRSSIVLSDEVTRLLAFTSSGAGTRFGMMACFAGLKNVLAVATIKTRMKTHGSQARAMKGIMTVRTARATSARIMTRWRLKRSTIGPATRPNRMVGTALVMKDTATTEAE